VQDTKSCSSLISLFFLKSLTSEASWTSPVSKTPPPEQEGFLSFYIANLSEPLRPRQLRRYEESSAVRELCPELPLSGLHHLVKVLNLREMLPALHAPSQLEEPEAWSECRAADNRRVQ